MALSTYSYPIKGIFFFISNWSLVRRVLLVLVVIFFVALAIIGFSFGFLLKVQATALINANCPAWLAWIVSVIFCLIESAISTIIIYLIITPIWQDALFDDVLRLKGVGHVLDKDGKKSTSDLLACCRGICSGLEIKGWSVNQSRAFAWKNKGSYIRFGAMAVALELIPIANFLFFWTNVVGAALWTADRAAASEVNDDSSNLIDDDNNNQSFSSTLPYQSNMQTKINKKK
ncbi:7728_t:CDS:2 [Entrophospora sp. SA101]|nr:5108_t:CDS:2 [Entrophospora sp. SA101]CAJ0755508.1 7728_t:CDS:2 [Entrophospora sp. SA101]CAJ0834669.1 9194_t:CDS:2 [Entrophospora sp. SA101]CAJ0912994.1 2473_t:CDS:2 [Entrophospora sp. SA101]